MVDNYPLCVYCWIVLLGKEHLMSRVSTGSTRVSTGNYPCVKRRVLQRSESQKLDVT